MKIDVEGHALAHPLNPELETALQRAQHAEAELRAMQNSRAWRTLQKLRKVLRRA